MIDFSYLKNWIDYPNPRPIILECEPSQSGMSLSVYGRDRKIFSIGGCGFDRIGCAIAKVLETCWREELEAADLSGLYGARKGSDGKVWLEGVCGAECMAEIGAVIGLNIRFFDSRHGTIIHITRK